MKPTHSSGVIEVSFDDFAGFAVAVTDAAAIFFSGQADDPVTPDFLYKIIWKEKKIAVDFAILDWPRIAHGSWHDWLIDM